MHYLLTRFFGIFTIAFTYSLAAIAQPSPQKHEPVKLTFYYNTVWELTTPENSMYRREAYFDLTDMVFDGVFSDYNKKDELIADGYYNHGIKSGIFSEYVNHAVKTKVEYSGDNFTFWEWNDGKTEGVKNGTGKFTAIVYYFVVVDGRIAPRHSTLTGEFRNGRRIGKWVHGDAGGPKTDVEFYVNGRLQKRVHYAKDDSVEMKEVKSVYLSLNSLNTESLTYDKVSFLNLNQYFQRYVTYPVTFNRTVTYPGGIRSLLKRLSAEMMVPERNIEVMELKIDENGQVAKSRVVRSISPVFDNLGEDFIELHNKRFLPAIRNGRPEVSVIYLPIASGDQWIRTLDEAPVEWLLDFSNFD